MYVTRPLSYYKKFPDALSLPPEGPNSGYLVIQDEESETYSFFGLFKNRYLKDLPFPQNKKLTTRYSSRQSGSGQLHNHLHNHEHVSLNDVVFIPVLNQPLSSNRYYAVQPHGSHQGEAFTCSKEEDMVTCCFCSFVQDVKPKPLNPHDIFQQLEIFPYKAFFAGGGKFYAKSVAPDGFPPHFLRRKAWQIYTKTPKNYQLSEAPGINTTLRARLPESSEPVVVGKWYCPFMLIKEGRLSDQVKKSIFYEMTLEQKWEQIIARDNADSEGNVLSMETDVQSEVVFVGGSEAVWDEKNVVDGVVWFTSFGNNTGEEESVGLSLEIIQRMRWEEERVGWIGVEDRIVKVKRAEEFVGVGGEWKKFGCYVLVERFILKRMDGSLVMTYDFKHTHQIKCVFE